MPFRIRSILLASDLSASEREVLRSAGALAALTGAALHVVHALEPDAAGEADGRGEAERLRESARALEEQLRRAAPEAAAASSTHVDLGAADEVILRRAAAVDADLVVIGPHRVRPEGEDALGTTADRLVRTSEVPCLIVRHPVSLPLRRVLVPSDLSDAAAGALNLAFVWGAALRMPTSSGGETALHVLHVHAPGEAGHDGAARELHDQVQGAGGRTGCGTMLRVHEHVVESGAAAEAILRFAREHGADLLVMGTHGQTASRRELVGSVSSLVARRARCPVLLVPPAVWQARLARETVIRPPR
jgi:nucleotide-binding universal stress UspA family protein